MTDRTLIEKLIIAIDIHMSAGFPTHKAVFQARNRAMDALAASRDDGDGNETPTLTTPQEPDPALLQSMAMRYRHDFGLLDSGHQAAILVTMRQLWEEVVGQGFYRPSSGEPSSEDQPNTIRVRPSTTPTVTAYSSPFAKSLRLGFDGLDIDLKAAEASLLVTQSGGNCPPITKMVDPEYLSQAIGFLNAAKEKLNGIMEQVQDAYLSEIGPIVPAQIIPEVHECRLEDDDYVAKLKQADKEGADRELSACVDLLKETPGGAHYAFILLSNRRLRCGSKPLAEDALEALPNRRWFGDEADYETLVKALRALDELESEIEFYRARNKPDDSKKEMPPSPEPYRVPKLYDNSITER